MAWEGLFQHLKGPFMDDYHEFKCAHDIQIEEWQLYWSPNHVSITIGIMAPSGATTPSINLANGSGSAIGNGAIGSGGTTKGGGARASTNTWGPLFVFNPIVEFLREL
jgi:hypothetical protein